MDFSPHELFVRVCIFLCTASLCRLCVSKALRIALKDDPNAWKNALQSTWWYPIDTLKRHDNFTFWCSSYSIRTRLSLNRQIRDRAHIDLQFAVVSYQGEVMGTCFLGEMDLPPYEAYPEDIEGQLSLRWIACGEFPCSTFLSSKDTVAQVTLDIFTVFKDKIHFTTKSSFKFNPERSGFYAHSQFLEHPDGPEIEFNGDVCIVQFYLFEPVYDLYADFSQYVNGHEPEEFFKLLNSERSYDVNGEHCNLNDLFLDFEKRTRRGWGKTRKFIRETIIDSSCEKEHLITLQTTCPIGGLRGDSIMVTLPSGKLMEVTVPNFVRHDRKIRFEVPERDAMA